MSLQCELVRSRIAAVLRVECRVLVNADPRELDPVRESGRYSPPDVDGQGFRGWDAGTKREFRDVVVNVVMIESFHHLFMQDSVEFTEIQDH